MSLSLDINPNQLRADAESHTRGLAALIAQARHLAATLNLGIHGRRRVGMGEEFWQYRQAVPGDSPAQIDWRKSGAADAYFVKQTEWQSAQAVHFWVDQSASMQFGDGNKDSTKGERARLLALACSLLLSKGGERFALYEDPELPRTGEAQIARMAYGLLRDSGEADFSMPTFKAVQKGSRAVFASDFLGDWDSLVRTISQIADQDVQGVLVQILDPVELSFPFSGRTIFESMKGTLSFETRRANALREEYLERLEQRQNALEELSKSTGWRYLQHSTDTSALKALLWIYTTLEQAT